MKPKTVSLPTPTPEGETNPLARDLAEALARADELEREVERWRCAATGGVEAVSERALLAARRFEERSAELDRTLKAAYAELEASRADIDAAARARDAEVLARAAAMQARDDAVRARDNALLARDAARTDLKHARRRAGWLKTKVLRREARRIQMMRSASWRITAPLRWLSGVLRRAARGGARLRRRLLRR